MSWLFRTSIDSDVEEIDPDLPEHCTVAILGTGLAGLGTGIRLAKAGRGDFVLLEQAIGVRANVRRRALESGVWAHIRFGTELRAAEWDAVHSWWRLRTNRGSMTANFLLVTTEDVSGSVCGRDGRSLQQVWAHEGGRAYPAAAVSGFPNLFLAHQEQIRMISSGLKLFAAKGIREFEVRSEVETERPPRRLGRHFYPHDYHLTVGQPRSGDPRYRPGGEVPRPSAVGAERLAP
ncbi:MAG TPA: hypothetical protein VGJ14_02890 [Sporichthyaceae bacterium]|jgi:hypothetical protein